MRDKNNGSVRDFFLSTPKKEEIFSALKASESINLLKRDFLKRAEGIKRETAFAELEERVKELLDFSFVDVLAQALKKYAALQKYTDKEKYPPNKVVLAPLGVHEIKSVHHPYLEVLVDDHVLGKIVFDLVITLRLEGLILKIQDGKIREVRTGKCAGKGVFKLKDLVIFQKESREIPLPGVVSFEKGLPI